MQQAIAAVRHRGARYWPEIVVGLAPLVVYWRLVFAGQVLYWGLPALQFVPWRVLVNQALSHGHLPLWTPLLGMGAPILANYQSAALYPPNLLALVWPPESTIGILAVLHLGWAGLGMARLVRQIGLGDFGAAVAGLTFGLSGYLTGRLWFITIDNALAWLPWIVLYASRPDPAAGAAPPESRPGLRRFLGLALLIALQLLAGHAQSSFYTLLLTGAWITWRAVNPDPAGARAGDARFKLRILISDLVVFSLAVSLAAALAALQLVPTYELLILSPRASAVAYDLAMTYSLWPWRLLTFVIPNLFGHPADHNYWGYAAFWEDNAYLGLLPLIFALYAVYGGVRAVFARSRKQPSAMETRRSGSSRLMGFALLLIAVSILLALGQNTPVFPFVYRFVPGFNLFQAPARMLIWYTFGVSLLAAIGAERWQASDRKRYWSRLGVAGSLAMLVLGVTGGIYISDARAVTFGTGLAWTAAFSAGVFGLLLAQDSSAWWRWAALGFLILDLGLAGVRSSPITDRTFYDLAPSFHLDSGRLFEFAEDEKQVKFGELLRFKSFDPLDAQAFHDSLLTNLNALSGQASANNFDPLLPARYAAYLKVMESSPRLMDLADVSAVVKPAGAVTPRQAEARRWRIVYQAQEVPSVEAALQAITLPSFDPDQLVILEAPPAATEWPGLELDPNQYVVSVNLDRPGYVLVSDTYYPGWRAWVDGAPQPVRVADVSFRAVAVPAGTHTVRLAYAPFSVTAGLGVSLAAALLFVLLAYQALGRWPARSPRP